MSPLAELAVLFLRLGTTAFGGPAAHIAMMQDEVVRRRRWLTDAEFLDLVSACNLVPGPNSTELAIHIGHRRAGMNGLLVAGTCFILPASLVTLAIAWAYVRFGSLPKMQGVLVGVKPVILAVIFQAIVSLAKSATKDIFLGGLGFAAAGAILFFRAPELLVLFAAGFVSMLRLSTPRGAPVVVAPASKLFLVFAKIGSVLFGSGYVLVAFLRADLVEHRGWLTENQLVDAVAVGQLTPGPVFTTATFIGYVISGLPGAGAATLGIFLPAFVFVAISGFLVPRLRRSPRAGRFLDGVNVASLALMATTLVDLGRSSLGDLVSAGLAVASAVLLFRFRINSAWLVLGGAAVGLLTHAG